MVDQHTLAGEILRLLTEQRARLSAPGLDATDRQLALARVDVYRDAFDLAMTVEPAALLEFAETAARQLWQPPPIHWRDEIGVAYIQARAWQRVVWVGWPRRDEVAPRWPEP